MATSKSGFRYPRSLGLEIFERIVQSVDHEDCFLGGSYVRELPSIGDIDIVILTNNIEKTQSGLSMLHGTWLRRGISSSMNFEIPDQVGFRYYRNGYKLPQTIQVDFWLTDNPGNWGAYCMFCAGDQRLNIIQRSKASKQGYLLGFSLRKKIGMTTDKKGNPTIEYGDPINLPTEQEVYKYLGWDWIPYKDRSLLSK